MAQNQADNIYTLNRDRSGAWTFRILLLLIPLGVVLALLWIAYFNGSSTQSAAPTPITTVVQRDGEVITTTTYLTPTANLGVFDPALGSGRPLATGLLILLVGAAVEVILIVWYGTFYLGNPRKDRYPLSLPLGSIRVLVIIMIVLILLIFALLPAPWGDNKAVTAIFSLLATVVGFYFGSATARESAQQPPGSAPTGPTGQSPAVGSVRPSSSPAGTHDVTIIGSGFETGSTSTFGDPAGGIKVNSTRFVSPTELIANITIDPQATAGPRDVTVQVPGRPLVTLTAGFTIN